MIETRGFTRKNDDGRNADRRLANHRLQPLGHLTAATFPKYTPACRLRDSRFRFDCPWNCPCRAAESDRSASVVHANRRSSEGSGFLVNDASAELAASSKVVRLGQRPLLRKAMVRGDSVAAALSPAPRFSCTGSLNRCRIRCRAEPSCSREDLILHR